MCLGEIWYEGNESWWPSRCQHSCWNDIEFTSRPLHVLVLNAGVMWLPWEQTEDGFERTMQTNYIGNFYLTKLLARKMLASAPARVVVVAAESHRWGWYKTMFRELKRQIYTAYTVSQLLRMPLLPLRKWVLCNLSWWHLIGKFFTGLTGISV